MELCRKRTFNVELSKTERDKEFGMKLEAEVGEDGDQAGDMFVFVIDVNKFGLAAKRGKCKEG